MSAVEVNAYASMEAAVEPIVEQLDTNPSQSEIESEIESAFAPMKIDTVFNPDYSHNIEENNLSGTIPDRIGELKELQFLDLSQNQLSDPSLVDEAEAMNHFKDSIKEDPNGALANWNHDSIQHCNWTGIKCDRDSGHVVSISIQDKKLKVAIVLAAHDSEP
nr:LRR receptor-like serine/threonine-protein kinase FLS2 [Tanacetum cinerariifolium]